MVKLTVRSATKHFNQTKLSGNKGTNNVTISCLSIQGTFIFFFLSIPVPVPISIPVSFPISVSISIPFYIPVSIPISVSISVPISISGFLSLAASSFGLCAINLDAN